MKIVKAYTRHYRDSGQTRAYVEWSDGSRTEGDAFDNFGDPRPVGSHMQALFDRAQRDGIVIKREVW